MTLRSGTKTLADWGEKRFLQWVRRALRSPTHLDGASLALGIGDDAALIRPTAGVEIAVTTDALIEGVHFRRDFISPRDLGARAWIVNLSDLAAMAAEPLAGCLALGLPPKTPLADARAFFLGLRSAAQRWGCPLAGGDLVRASKWTIAVTLIGRVEGRAALRDAARPGQRLYLTGIAGESAAGLTALRRGDAEPTLIGRHRRPTPRLKEARLLRSLCPDLAMIDVSDGVWNDAGQLARESGVRLRVRLSALPASAGLRRYARRRGVAWEDWALFGGEDYELLFTTRVGAASLRSAFASGGVKTPLSEIGDVIAGRGVQLLAADGHPLRRRDRTFEHFR